MRAMINKASEKSRDELIDIARLVAMSFIVIGHTNIRSPYVQGCPELAWLTWLGGVDVLVFFFFFAGYFAKQGPGWFNFKRSLSVFISLCLWAVIGHIGFGIIANLSKSGQIDLFASDMFCVLGNLFSVATPGNYDLWFLKVLVVFFFFSPTLGRLKTVHIWVVAAVFLLLNQAQTLVPQKIHEWIPYFLKGNVLTHWASFCIGMAVKRSMTTAQINDIIEKIWVYVPLLLVCNQVLFFIEGEGARQYAAQYVNHLVGVIYVLCIAKWIQKLFPRLATWISQFGASVFFIYVVQEILVIASREFFTVYPINRHLYVFVPFGIIALCIVGFRFIVRYMPRLAPYMCLYSPQKH